METTINQLKILRNEIEFKSIYDNANKIGEIIGAFLTIPRILQTQKHKAYYNICNDDHCTYYRISIFYPYLGDLLYSFNERFTFSSLQ